MPIQHNQGSSIIKAHSIPGASRPVKGRLKHSPHRWPGRDPCVPQTGFDSRLSIAIDHLLVFSRLISVEARQPARHEVANGAGSIGNVVGDLHREYETLEAQQANDAEERDKPERVVGKESRCEQLRLGGGSWVGRGRGVGGDRWERGVWRGVEGAFV